MRYNNYHKHTSYSNISTPDSVAKPIDYILRAKELGADTYFTTEHGWGGNIFEAFTLCEQHEMKCIFGVEAYYVPDSSTKEHRGYHLMLIAKTNKGRKDINEILSQANVDGFYYHPRVDKKHVLALNPEDVIVTSACIASPMFKGDDWEEEFYIPFRDHFGDSFYLEVQAHPQEIQAEYNKKIMQLHYRDGVKIIHANDSHYIQDKKGREVYLAAKGMKYADEDTFVLDYPDSDTIFERYREQGVLTEKEVKEALENTLVFDECESIYLDKEIKLPKIVEGDSNTHLKKIINQEFKKKISSQNLPPERLKEYLDAVRDEVKTIEECHMADYFILDYYIVKRAVEKGAILTRSGRGSSVSFVVNYLLGFTEIDRLKSPIKLYPSRFMSAERILKSRSLPD